MNVFDGLLSLIAPHDCVACGTEGWLLCDWCRIDALEPVPPRCYRCRAQSQDFTTCAVCRHESRLKNVWVASEYHGVGKTLIGRLKFERTVAAADEISALMAATLPYLPDKTVVTFAPTATSRHRMRGYDQSELIAKRLAKLRGLPFRRLLLREGQTRQVGANKAERKQQLAEAFRPFNSKIIKNADILLVDDIVTTGATIEAAAQTLKNAGAKQIYAAAFAQKN